MTALIRLTVASGILLNLSSSVWGQDVIDMVHLNRAASSIAKTAGQLFQENDELKIASDEETNTLILRGPKDVVAQAVKAIQELDRPRQLVTISLSMNVAGEGDKSDDEITLTTPDEQRIRIALEQTVPVVSGFTVIAGREIRNSSPQTFGTFLEATPKIMGDRIALKLLAEKAWLEAATADDIPPVKSESRIDTTIQLTPGEPQKFRVKVNGSPAREMSVTVAATIGTKAPAIRKREADGTGRTGIFSSDAQRNRSADYMFGRFDANEDGKITQEEWDGESRLGSMLLQRGFEFQANMSQEQFRMQYKKPDPDRWVKMAGQLFVQLDTNKDGKLSQDEWDGKSGVTILLNSRIEFKDGMTKEQLGEALNRMYARQEQSSLGYQPPDPNTTAKLMFSALDQDEDGTVSKGEWETSRVRGLLEEFGVQFKDGLKVEELAREVLRIRTEVRNGARTGNKRESKMQDGKGAPATAATNKNRTQQIAGFLFKRFDSDGDNRISQEEWDAQAVLSESYTEKGFVFTAGMTRERFTGEIAKTLPKPGPEEEK